MYIWRTIVPSFVSYPSTAIPDVVFIFFNPFFKIKRIITNYKRKEIVFVFVDFYICCPTL
jgi:hypothetical protein